MIISVGARLHSTHSATMSEVSDTGGYKMNLQNIIRFIIVLVMVAAFLYQMWEVFGQFLSGLTTVATSFEEKEEFDLPSFAFCDSRAFTRSVTLEETFANYNETTFDLDQKIEFLGIHIIDGLSQKVNYFEINHTTQVVPTFFNGYCKIYEFQQSLPYNTYIGINGVCTLFSSVVIILIFNFQNLICL